MRIIKLKAATLAPTPMEKGDIVGLIDKMIPKIPDLRKIKGNPAAVKGLGMLLGPMADQSEDMNSFIPLIRKFLDQHDTSHGNETKTDESGVVKSTLNMAKPGAPTIPAI